MVENARLAVIGFIVVAGAVTSPSEISWLFDVTVKPDSQDALKELIAEMATAAEADEPETLTYEWVISVDGNTAQVYERYADCDAALLHLASFNENFADRLMALVEPTGMTVYGEPSEALRKELSGADPVYMHEVAGFNR